jgi:SanA protein
MVKWGKWHRLRWGKAGLALTVVAGALMLFAGGLLWFWPRWVESRYAPAILPAESVRTERVAIVFGARVYGSGRLSSMLRDRVDTAIDLYKRGKVQKLLVSGDNQFADYNEPAAMMAYAIAQGVPEADIQPDYGGRRTYDTCYRAKAIFQVDSAILVTQEFHLPRALFLCDQLGIDAVGVAADRRSYHPRSIAFSETREVPALAIALLDVIRRAPPPVLGEPIPIR